MSEQEDEELTIKELLAQDKPDAVWGPLWEFAKYVFDFAAKTSGILGGLETVYESMEDFCALKGIQPSPFCAFVFDARGGFLTQSKLPYYYRDEWNELFPDPLPVLTQLPEVLQEYKRFLEERKLKGDDHALLYLKKYQSTTEKKV